MSKLFLNEGITTIDIGLICHPASCVSRVTGGNLYLIAFLQYYSARRGKTVPYSWALITRLTALLIRA